MAVLLERDEREKKEPKSEKKKLKKKSFQTCWLIFLVLSEFLLSSSSSQAHRQNSQSETMKGMCVCVCWRRWAPTIFIHVPAMRVYWRPDPVETKRMLLLLLMLLLAAVVFRRAFLPFL
jgi:hypothetical protein